MKSGHDLFAEELAAEASRSNTFSTIKLNLSLSYDAQRLYNAVRALTLTRATTESASADWQVMLVLIHECTHYWHWIGTTFGFHTSRLTMAQSKLTQEILQKLDSAGVGPFPVPLRRFPLESIPTNVRDDVRLMLEMWDAIEVYKSALLGHNPRLEIDTDAFFRQTWPLVFRALAAFDSSTRLFGPNTHYGDAMFERAVTLTPTTRINLVVQRGADEQYPVSGRAILEGAAVFQEIMFLVQCMSEGTVDTVQAEARMAVVDQSIYGVSMNLTQMMLGFNSGNVFLLPYLLDLALMGIFDPLYTSPVTLEIGWHDVEPGARLYRALRVLRDLEISSIGEDEDACIEVVEEICKRLRWLPPTVVAGHAQRFALSPSDEGEMFKVAVDIGAKFFERNPYVELRRHHCAAMEARRADPAIFAQTFKRFGSMFGDLEKPGNYPELRPSIVLGEPFLEPNYRMLGLFIFHQIMREIANGSTTALNGEKILPRSLVPQSEVGDLLLASMWSRIGFPQSRFVSLSEWS